MNNNSKASVLARPLLQFSKHDAWTIGDSTEGTLVLGANGVGKSRASGAAIATAFLDNGFGGLVLTGKSEEVESWREFAVATGRLDDLRVIEPGGPYRFNPLDYEFHRSGEGSELTLNIVSLFLAAMSGGDGAVSNSEPFWNDTLQELLIHAIELAAVSGHGIDLSTLLCIIRSAPTRLADVATSGWQQSSECWSMLSAAAQMAEGWGTSDAERYADLSDTIDYWLGAFPSLAAKTRSIIMTSFTARAAGLLRRPLRKLLCTDTSPEVTPESSHRGKIIVVNLPVKEFGAVGRFAQMLYKTVWQRATERRSLTGDWKPVFLWVDEAQIFASPEDLPFLQTARSRVAATVYLSQNLPNFHAAFGRGNAQASTESLIGCLQTRILHANGCPTTNDWAERLFARDDTTRNSMNLNFGPSAANQTSVGFQDAREPNVPAIRFTTLKKAAVGQPAEAIVFQTGRRWRATGANHLTARFPLLLSSTHDHADSAPAHASA